MKATSKRSGSAYIGMDVHKESITAAILRQYEKDPVVVRAKTTADGVDDLVRSLKREFGDDLRACYEAGPTGFGLQRRLEASGVQCDVIAPSRVRRAAGDRVKTDRLDAIKLAQELRAGLLVTVHVPTPEEEAARELVRAAMSARAKLQDLKRQIRSFLLRNNVRRAEGDKWTRGFDAWLHSLQLPEPLATLALQMLVREHDVMSEQVATFDRHLADLGETPQLKRRVDALMCIKGIQLYTALVIATELGAADRFLTARQLMSYMGLTCAEDSTGQRQRRMRITKAGNVRARYIIVEAAQAAGRATVHCKRSAVAKRRVGQPQWAVDLGRKCERRLRDRYVRLTCKGKPHNLAVTACARELVGFIWAMLQQEAATRPQATVDADGVVLAG